MANENIDFSDLNALLEEYDRPTTTTAPPAAPAVSAPPAAPPTPAAPPEPEPVEIQPLTTGGDGGLVSGSVLDMAADKAKAGKAAQPERFVGAKDLLSDIRDYTTGHPDSENLRITSALRDLETQTPVQLTGFVGPTTPEMQELADMRRTMQVYQSLSSHLQRGEGLESNIRSTLSGQGQSGESSAAEQRLRERLPQARAQLANQLRDYVDANRSNLPLRQQLQAPSALQRAGLQAPIAGYAPSPQLAATAAAVGGLAGSGLPAAVGTAAGAALQKGVSELASSRAVEEARVARGQSGPEEESSYRTPPEPPPVGPEGSSYQGRTEPLRPLPSKAELERMMAGTTTPASGTSGVPEGIPTGYAQIGVDRAEAGTPDYGARWYREPGTTNFYVIREGQAPEKVDASNANLLKMLENIRLIDGVGGA